MSPSTQDAVEFSWGPVCFTQTGSGPPVVVLHNELGFQPDSALLGALAQSFTVLAPALPGFPPSAVPKWMRTVTEMATVMNQWLSEVEPELCGIFGMGFGGWLAAEMAVQRPDRVAWLALQAPVGLQPRDGEEIIDRFLFTEERFVEMGFVGGSASVSRYFGDPLNDELTRGWDAAREMVTRVAFKPYMFNPALRHLLPRLDVPTAIIQGDDDQLVPKSCADGYLMSLRHASLTTLPGGGHWLDLENSKQLADVVIEFGRAQASDRKTDR